MLRYTTTPNSVLKIDDEDVSVFELNFENIDFKTVESFGEEWNKFNSFNQDEITNVGNEYFDIVTPEMLNNNSLVLDVGCGSGRWTKYVATRSKFVESIDPSNAVIAATKLLKDVKNKRITKAGVDYIPFDDNSFDFVFSLGVLHHIPDTQKAMQSSVAKLKSGGYFLVYLYYALDNRGFIYKSIFNISSVVRYIISSLPAFLKKIVCDLISVFVYMPFVILCKLFSAIGLDGVAKKIPLYYYTNKSFNIIRNDALDRFGTPLEQRFSRKEIELMMKNCGLENIVFSEQTPYWHGVGRKK